MVINIFRNKVIVASQALCCEESVGVFLKARKDTIIIAYMQIISLFFLFFAAKVAVFLLKKQGLLGDICFF